jgi:hypothetical protein
MISFKKFTAEHAETAEKPINNEECSFSESSILSSVLLCDLCVLCGELVLS